MMSNDGGKSEATQAASPLDRRVSRPYTHPDALRGCDYEVRACSLLEAQDLVREYHYAKGGSNTACYTHGLYRLADGELIGIVWWLPPTRVACESVDKEQWKKVLSLTRMVMRPGAPKNSCSFLLSRSVKAIKKEGRFVALVTYADESQGHTGGVYAASGWTYVGRTGPYPRWEDETGRQVACKATKNRTKAEMIALGHKQTGRFYKHKYILRLSKQRAANAKLTSGALDAPETEK